MEGDQKKVCGCPHHKMSAIFLTLFGLVFLLGAFDVLSAKVVSIAWPLIIIAAGLTKGTAHKCTCCDKDRV